MMPPRPRMPAVLVALLLLVVPAAARAQPGDAPDLAELPVTRVVAFTGGVAYFEHEGTVDGSVELRLEVAAEDMDDLLQSLVLQDLDGGTIRPVRYPARDPLPRILDSYALDLSGSPTLAELLAQARGEAVRIEAGETIEGVIVSVEEVRPPDGPPRHDLTLSTATGLRRLALSEVRELRFARAELREDLAAALDAVARHRDADAAGVRLRFAGEGERRVRVGYVREMPVWKTSYRLVDRGDGTADLQGWAILDNPTDLDLVDVSVSFVAGQPISFVTELFEPVYVRRPRVAVGTDPAPVPEADAGTFDAAPAARAAPTAGDAAGFAAEAAAPELAGGGVEALAQGDTRGATFEYRVSEPVTVARHESAMIPFVTATLPLETLDLFDPAASDTNPLRAVRLTNDTDLHLAAGPVTLLGPTGFAGTARLGGLPPGEDRILAHAVDGDVRVAREREAEPRRVVGVRFDAGTLITSERERIRTTYRIDGGGEVPLLVIEHPRRDGFELVAPRPAPPLTRDGARLGVRFGDAAPAAGADDDPVPTHARCEAGEPCVLEVVEERTVRETIAITNLAPERIALFLENPDLSDADRAALQELLELQRRVARTEREIASRRERLDAIAREQDRIRRNMGELDRDASLYRRYLATLESQENEIARIDAELDDLRERRDELRGELDEALRSPGRG